MDFIPAGNLNQGLLSPQSFQGGFGLKGRTMFAAAYFLFLAPFLILLF
jgi:hypothetical protein